MDPRMMPFAMPLDVLFALAGGPPAAPPPPMAKTVAGFGRAKTPPTPVTRKVSSKVVGFTPATA